jgi:uncharacterized repeat protein (TIGR01451 family)
MLFALWPVMHAQAAGVAAGTIIQNTAQFEYTASSGLIVSDVSNTATLRVDEILDVTVSRSDTSDAPVLPGSATQPLSFTVTNNGNGQEAFRLTANLIVSGDQFDPVNARLAIDTNGNGQYDSSIDQIYSPGQNDPLMNPDTSVRVFVLSDIPSALQNGNRGIAELSAQAVTGTGVPGTSFAGMGNGGGDAVVGATRGRSVDTSAYVAALINAQFIKTQSVIDPQGGNSAVPGSIITYTLSTQVTGSGTLSGATIADAVPAQTSYIPGSLRLNGSPLTDNLDSDPGQLTANGIQVNLGTLAAPATQTVTFQVKLN